MYSGTDLLWASLLDKLWMEVEAVCGPGAVRLHRASISLSTEEESDSSKTKQIKRKAAIRKLALGAMLSLALGVITTTYLIELQDLRNKILGFFLSFAPSLYVAGTFIVKVLPDLLQSRGSKYLKEVKKIIKITFS